MSGVSLKYFYFPLLSSENVSEGHQNKFILTDALSIFGEQKLFGFIFFPFIYTPLHFSLQMHREIALVALPLTK